MTVHDVTRMNLMVHVPPASNCAAPIWGFLPDGAEMPMVSGIPGPSHVLSAEQPPAAGWF